MASKEHSCDKNAPVLSGFTDLFFRKLREHLDRKNQNPSRRFYIKKLESVYGFEISCMMHTFGDVARPLKRSVRYLETILRDQINLLLIEASKVPGSKALTHANLLTLLLNKKEKMVRLLHYLFLKDSTEILGKRKYTEYADVVDNAKSGKRVKLCLKFLSSIGAGDYDFQTVKIGSNDIAIERVARRFQMALKMSNEEYIKFSNKQSVCFYPKEDDGKFRKWILADKVTTLKPTAIALDILSYFARETVAEIVEASLQIRQPQNNVEVDVPNIVVKNNHQPSTDQAQTSSYSVSDIFSSRHLGLANTIPHNFDSSLGTNSSIKSGPLRMMDIFASSTSSLNKNYLISLVEESPPAKKRKMEIMDSDTKSSNEKSEIREIKKFQVSDVQKPKIPPRNPGNPITVEDLRSTVRNLILSEPNKFQFNKKKRILCI